MSIDAKLLIERIFSLTGHIRYVAVLANGNLSSQQRDEVADASTAESDHYEELLVNPTLLTLAGQRGAIDCGGLDHIVVAYGHFRQLVIPLTLGHVSVCFDRESHPEGWAARIRAICTEQAGELA